jgi:chromosome partitioning protein
MKIVFGNQKGGSGKSTLCILLANYLSIEKHKSVMVLDMDMQGTIDDKRIRDTYLNEDFPYKVAKLGISEYPVISEKLKALDAEGTYILMDLPGNLENPDLKYVLKEADFITCPFEYEFGSYVSTLDFRDLCQSIVPDKDLYFVPNKVQGNVKYETKTQIENELTQAGQTEQGNQKGILSKSLPHRVGLQRITTYQISEEESKFASDVFEFIYV